MQHSLLTLVGLGDVICDSLQHTAQLTSTARRASSPRGGVITEAAANRVSICVVRHSSPARSQVLTPQSGLAEGEGKRKREPLRANNVPFEFVIRSSMRHELGPASEKLAATSKNEVNALLIDQYFCSRAAVARRKEHTNRRGSIEICHHWTA